MAQINTTIDYLQFTSEDIPLWLSGTPLTGNSPMPYYQKCDTYDCGTKIHYGNSRSDMLVVVMSGKPCEKWRMLEFPGRLEYQLMRNSKFSRIDLCITVAGLQPLYDFYDAVIDRKIASKRFGDDESKTVSGGDGKPQTIYVGSLKNRSKKGVFRAYDKGRELGIDVMLSRFELEIRRKEATVAAWRVSKGVSVGELISSVVDIPDCAWWRDMVGSVPNSLPRYSAPTEAEGDAKARRWNWLLTQVAPALGKLLASDENAIGNFSKFMVEVNRAEAAAMKPENLTEKEGSIKIE